MTREDFQDALVILGVDVSSDHFKTWADRLKTIYNEQRQQIETLELACGAAVQEAQDQREEIARLREALQDFKESFEMDFVLDGVIVDRPAETCWSQIVRLYELAKNALTQEPT